MKAEVVIDAVILIHVDDFDPDEYTVSDSESFKEALSKIPGIMSYEVGEMAMMFEPNDMVQIIRSVTPGFEGKYGIVVETNDNGVIVRVVGDDSEPYLFSSWQLRKVE